jgi:hypothetical protein
MPVGPMPWRNRWCWCSPGWSPQPAASRFPITSCAAPAPPPSPRDKALPDPEWLAIKTTFQADMTVIKAALKAGQEITGAQLIFRRSWRIC